ncbi:MAG TPA: arginine N-succinyltransferase [Myxococcaceae bacterium]|nr:arginine N-succinyltransferase [Myxococcaceae bacterium]
MFLLRDAQKSDLPSIKRLAVSLNTVNLPNDEDDLAALLDRSMKSFSGRIEDPREREYLFVLEDVATGKIAGTSLIIAQHGTFEAPHVFYEVTEREHYSASIDRHFRHKVLSIAYNYDGPTEIGGLVVDPSYRRSPERAGKQLSYVRLLFIAMHRSAFRDKVLAELLPPLLPNGKSLLWEAIGGKFTGLTYQDADRLSRQNKEFIKELFPASDIYATLFPEKTQRVIGEVAPASRPVKKMLERIGFRYAEHIDPFDGGPHYEAATAEVSLIKQYRSCRVSPRDLGVPGEAALIASKRSSGRNRFRAVKSEVAFENRQALMTRSAKDLLQVGPGATVGIVPFPEAQPLVGRR